MEAVSEGHRERRGDSVVSPDPQATGSAGLGLKHLALTWSLFLYNFVPGSSLLLSEP